MLLHYLGKLQHYLVTAEPPFTVKTTDLCHCVHHTGWKEGSIASCNMLASRLMFTKSVTVSVAELFLSSIGVKVNGQSCWNILLSQQMLNAIIYRVIFNNFVFQQDSAQMHLAFNSRTAAVQNSLSERMLFLSFCILPGSAEALVRWGGKIKHLLIAYYLRNICAKNYQNRFLYVSSYNETK